MKGWVFVVLVASVLSTGSSHVLAEPGGIQNPQAQPTPIAPTGGLQLSIQPRRAQVFVDGDYKGVVDDFDGYFHPLELRAGLHRVEIFAAGYWPLVVDITIVPNRTRTYRTTLQEASNSL